MGMGLCFWIPAQTTYPFVICRLVNNPFVYTTVASMIKQGLGSRVGCGMGIPQGNQLIRIAVNSPPAITDNTGFPMPFFRVMDTGPIMGAGGLFGGGFR